MMTNIPEIKLGLIAVSRDCFPVALSERRRACRPRPADRIRVRKGDGNGKDV